jgi:hypothetical protein
METSGWMAVLFKRKSVKSIKFKGKSYDCKKIRQISEKGFEKANK